MDRTHVCGLRNPWHGPYLTALAVLPALCVAPLAAQAQSKPFPTAANYAAGFLPTNVTSADALTAYTYWKQHYLKTDCGNGYYRVAFDDPSTTVSEGQGYGMVLTAYYGDRTEFDGLWKYAQKNLNSDGMMGWHVTCSGFTSGDGGAGCATDGDEDIAFGLVLATYQWGDSYKATATDFINTLKSVDFMTCASSGRNFAKPGNWSNCSMTNSSYFAPGYYRVFQEFTGDAFWGKAADDSLAILALNHNATTGLIANEVDENGVGSQPVNYNGCRIPWRVGLDYLWYGTAGAKAITDKMTDWADSVGVGTLVDGLNLNGSANSGWTGSNAFNGGWACGAMTKSQDRATRFTTNFMSNTGDQGYYNTTLKALYLLVLSGNEWKPGGTIAAAPTVTLAAQPTTVQAGGNTTLTWSSTNATECTASGGWTGTKATSGSEASPVITQTTTFTLTCTGPGGAGDASTTVAIGAASCTSPSDCDDGNSCTTDTCVAGACEHTQIADCCSGSACGDGTGSDSPETSSGLTGNGCSCDAASERARAGLVLLLAAGAHLASRRRRRDLRA